MVGNTHRLSAAFFVAALILSSVGTANAEIHTILDEHFVPPGEWDNPLAMPPWPWFTNRDEAQRWHWNPQPTHRLTETDYTDYSWGLQDFMYHVRQENEDDVYSLWCARTNRGNTNNPRWPEDLGYMNNQNAWVWWGPFRVRQAVTAGASFWVNVDIDDFGGDSLSIVVCNSDNTTLDGDEFRENCPIGMVIKRGTDNWEHFQIDFASLELDGEEFSWIGESERLYLGFVWHSDDFDITGRGAFIDDVIINWDDGLFDIRPVVESWGYLTENEIDWREDPPDYLDEVYFRLYWEVVGSDEETPEFTISCFLDGELIFEEIRQAQGNRPDELYSTIEEPWLASAGNHVLRWQLDTNNDAEESRENNNIYEVEFSVEWDPAPVFTIEVEPGNEEGIWDVFLSVYDSLEVDSLRDPRTYSILCYVTQDSSGWAEDRDIIQNWNPIWWDLRVSAGEHVFSFNPYDILGFNGGTLYLGALCSDNNPDHISYVLAVLEVPNSVAGTDVSLPAEFELNSIYPNPFNNMVKLNYSVPHEALVNITVFDIVGREVERMESLHRAAGVHTTVWQPKDVTAGVYFFRLELDGEILLRKTVYLP